MVGQSVMCAMVMVFLLGSPPHSWGNMLGEGSPSLNPHQICWIGHQSCSIWMLDRQWLLVCILVSVCPGCLVRAIRWF